MTSAEATYSLLFDGAEIGRLVVAGHDQLPAPGWLAPPGSAGQTFTFAVFEGAPWPNYVNGIDFRYHTWIGADGFLRGAAVVCDATSASEGSDCGVSGVTRTVRMIPGAMGLPASFGLGLFAGRSIHAGDSGVILVDGLNNRTAISWIAMPVETGAPCVDIKIDVVNETWEPVALPVAPLRATLTACDAEFLPRQVKIGPLTFRRDSFAPPQTEPITPAPDPVPSRPPEPCQVVLPPASSSVLPYPAWEAWAKQNDSFYSQWLAERPHGFVAPGYAQVVPDDDAPTGGISGAWTISGPAAFVDPSTGTAQARVIGQSWDTSPIQAESSFAQSRPLDGDSVFSIASGQQRRACLGNWVLSEATQQVLNLSGFAAASLAVSVVPDVGAAFWQGHRGNIPPFDVTPAAPDLYDPSGRSRGSWWIEPEGSISLVRFAAIDLGGSVPRFVDVNPNDYPEL